MRGGDLLTRITQAHHFDEPQARAIMQQIVAGVAHLHSLHVAHRDLKPENLLFTDDTYSCIKIGDFGFAKQVCGGVTLQTPLYTPFYACTYCRFSAHRCGLAPVAMRLTAAGPR